jgi:hypothetical protein
MVSKRILIDIGHPAHVHLFKNAIRIWQSHGHSIAITIREKDIISQLLEDYGFSYSVASKARKGILGLTIELIEHDFGVLKAAIKHRSQYLIGSSVSITHVAPLVGAKSIVFGEDDAEVAKTFVRISYPIASKIVTPVTLTEDHGKKHIKYNGYQKLAYLHPKYFTPNPEIKQKLGVGKDEKYFILRFVSLDAYHDYGESGIGENLQRRLVDYLSVHGRVFISSQRPLPEDLRKYLLDIDPIEMHDALNYASIFIGDSQSMNVESAILGVPSIRINSFADRCSILQELQNDFQLTYSYFPYQEKEIFELLDSWVKDDALKSKWELKKEKMLNDKIDVTSWMVNFIEELD